MLYINDLPDTAISQVFLFADDTKLYRQIRNDSDHKIFQDDISKLQSWADDWLLKFYPDKCKILGVGKKELTHQYYMTKDDHSLVALSWVQDEKDVGVTFDEDMTFRNDINTRANNANSVMGIIRTYTYLDPQSFKLLFKSLVRPHLEYGAPIRNPRLKRDITELEKGQRRATRQVPQLRGLSYEDRLRKLQLPTLRYRRLRGDMIETYKLLHDIYDPILPKLLDPVEKSMTRGHSFKLPKKSAKNNIKGHVFSHRIVNDWSSLPEDVVSAPSVNAFKNRLDSHWRNHPWLYDWEAELELRPNRLSQACAPHGNKDNV